ncbi:helix-turn-helix domain-containing protein [Klenkia sp. LSe6-5]|uniref:Helix-turn-helix domain-containing protein n=1 Tax=Klenkia sesuvii TaxID=3103137 RepID=A0ABU8DXV3_9ACTN
MPHVLADRRARKKARTRVEVRRTAHRLFAERGFDAVTVADVAEAADVAVQTVFNHFPTKEDLFFDGRDWWAHGAAAAVRARGAGTGAVTTAHAWLEHHVLYVPRLLRRPAVARYVETVLASPALTLRQRELFRHAEGELAAALHEAWVDQLGDLPGVCMTAELLSGVLITSAQVVLNEQWRAGQPQQPCPSPAVDRAVEAERAHWRQLSRTTFSAVLAGLGQVADAPDAPTGMARVAQLEQHLPPDLVAARRMQPGLQRASTASTGIKAPSTRASSSSAGTGSANAV